MFETAFCKIATKKHCNARFPSGLESVNNLLKTGSTHGFNYTFGEGR